MNWGIFCVIHLELWQFKIIKYSYKMGPGMTSSASFLISSSCVLRILKAHKFSKLLAGLVFEVGLEAAEACLNRLFCGRGGGGVCSAVGGLCLYGVTGRRAPQLPSYCNGKRYPIFRARPSAASLLFTLHLDRGPWPG